jgi:hypothetical protein
MTQRTPSEEFTVYRMFHKILAWAHRLISLLPESNTGMPCLILKSFEENEDIVARRSWQMASFFNRQFTRALRSYVQTIFRMEQCKHLVVYWHDKGYHADKMHQKPLARIKGIVPAYSTITNWIRVLDWNEHILRRAPGSGRWPVEEIDVLITLALEEKLFHSVGSLATAIKSPPATVLWHLRAADYVLRHL